MGYDARHSDQANVEGRPVSSSSAHMATSVHRVVIYVNDYCANCAYAREIADLIRSEYPHIAVDIVDLANPRAPVPESVFATPTYLLDGRLWSLGNPSPRDVRETLKALA